MQPRARSKNKSRDWSVVYEPLPLTSSVFTLFLASLPFRAVFVMELANQAVEMLFCERFSFVRNIAALAGTGFLLKLLIGNLLSLLNTFRAFFLAPWGISRLNLKKYGNWAGELKDTCYGVLTFVCSCNWCIRRYWSWICTRGE